MEMNSSVFYSPQSSKSRPWCWPPTVSSTPKPPCPILPLLRCRLSRTQPPLPPSTPASRGVQVQLPWTSAALSRGHRWAFSPSEMKWSVIKLIYWIIHTGSNLCRAPKCTTTLTAWYFMWCCCCQCCCSVFIWVVSRGNLCSICKKT